MKQLFHLLLTAILLFSAVPLSEIHVHAANIIDNGDYVYQVLEDGKSVSIITYRGNSLYVSLPSRVEKYKVTTVGAAAFMTNSTIKELELSESIKTVAPNAFAECTALKKLTIPGNVKTIGDSAFIRCTALQTVKIEDGTQKIGDYCFAGCRKLEELSLPNSLDEIGAYAFFSCTALKEIQVPKALQRFGGYALEGTAWMQQQTSEFVIVGDGILVRYNGKDKAKSLPDSVKSIGEYAFAKNTEITDILLPRTVISVGAAAFEDCTSLEKVSLPDNVRSIGANAFRHCDVLDNVKLPKNLSKMEAGCFQDCRGLREITIPSSVKQIGSAAFQGCTALETISFQNGLQTVEDRAFADCTRLGRVVFPETVKQLGVSVFCNCHSLTRVEFNSAVNLPSAAFTDCIHLTDAAFYKDPSSIAEHAFHHCSPDLTLYSSQSDAMQQYAKDNQYNSETLRSMKVYVNRGALKPEEDANETLFSGGYTAIVIMILIIDFAIVLFFAVHILSSQPKGKHGKTGKYAGRHTAKKT